jgi:hypothetical protein
MVGYGVAGVSPAGAAPPPPAALTASPLAKPCAAEHKRSVSIKSKQKRKKEFLIILK